MYLKIPCTRTPLEHMHALASTKHPCMEDVQKIDSEIFTAQAIILKALPHQEMVTSHSSYNNLPSFCVARSLHTAQLVSVEQ